MVVSKYCIQQAFPQSYEDIRLRRSAQNKANKEAPSFALFLPHYASVAQLVEHPTDTRTVESSNLSACTKIVQIEKV